MPAEVIEATPVNSGDAEKGYANVEDKIPMASEKFTYDDEVSHGWFIDSFKRAHHKAEEQEHHLNTTLTSRHIQMIAIGGTIFESYEFL
jgi:amino acid permease